MEQPIQAHRTALEEYLAELDRWNARVNLTSVPGEERWRRHVEESARLLAAAGAPAEAEVVDVGSGTGAPGIVAAILRPDLRLTLLEADARKAAFLDHVAGVLGLAHVRVECRRAEEAGRDPALRERFDRALSRAAAPPAVLCELALPLVRVGGRVVALVSDATAATRACAHAAALLGGGEPAAIDEHLITVTKIAPTDERYPRRSGIPQRRPLV